MQWVSFVECRCHEAPRKSGRSGQPQAESVVFDVEVELPQPRFRAHDIHRQERIAVSFWAEDTSYPEVLALREDFPAVPHINIRPFEVPRSLCLFDEPYSELKLHWTAPGFIERIRRWLAETANGTLHKPDQPLEQFFIGAHSHIIIPSDLFSSRTNNGLEKLAVSQVRIDRNRFCLIAKRPGENGRTTGVNQAPEFVASVLVATPQQHGVIHRQPANLHDLHQVLASAGVDLLTTLRGHLQEWRKDEALLCAGLILLLVLPKTREAGGAQESSDVWAFMCVNAEERGSDAFHPRREITAFPQLSEVGEQLGLWEIRDGKLGIFIRQDEEKRGDHIELVILNPSFSLSRQAAASFNKLSVRNNQRIAAVGMGALGSQVFFNLVRAAYGEWTIIDNDFLLPHNLARHALYGAVAGSAKVDPLAFYANHTIDGAPIAQPIVADVLNPGEEAGRVTQSLSEAEVIFDFSASVAVARHLSNDISSKARRASLFLNPIGTDLVLLAEDAKRQIPLTSLEMQYYRLLTEEKALSDHLQRNDGRIRYAYSCRDLSGKISQEDVAQHAAIGSRALRRALSTESATISVWKADEEGGVQHFKVTPSPVIVCPAGEWTISTDAYVMDKLGKARLGKLPKETGGVLIGSFDMEHSVVYVVDALLSPPDSQEQPTGFVRGFQGLKSQVEEIGKSTSGGLQYVGEWHSHPDGYACRPSVDDLKLFQWLADKMFADGLLPLMLIMGGQNQHAWYLGAMPAKQKRARRQRGAG
jgi:integrative and conjugative element protein (TIGR02256 family)